ncbi:hypothetical protein G6F16_010194 [Rhizopus arrhizus]|nr:hypothetical protein G6F20_009905 [Rhizopus arrhizus]KAG0825724.1 hypothetical protein G6F19_009672 [Rhizopus arrhizus]KAG0826483.1 hypothetical protein G6F18_009933 [Rhizopus arrhizus]KAG0850089.1 hypothetical protein G6F17_010179 [Rhizopus arrhizus]KAG0865487.1 hypothetical protein G6F16_010194 [Rhizopus arrhizus]
MSVAVFNPVLNEPETSPTKRKDSGFAMDEKVISTRILPQDNTKRKTYADDTEEEEVRVTIGTKVAEGHPNYQLMYDMLTGIRIAVGRVSAKIQRPLTEEDFTAAHKLAFDETGNELTPGVKYDFKFKDYSPWVFRHLREKFHIDAADYLMSLTNKYILSEIVSPGKSGSFFYYSRDYRFIIKTIHHSEHKFMRKILKQYHEHVCHNPNTLLCRFYGLHRIKLPRGKKIHFVIMGNVLPPNKDIHATFDLKGSTFGRLTSEDEINKNPHAVLKDQNWVKKNEKIQLGEKKKKMFLTQLEKDVDTLKRLNIMDYSLLVGIHDMKKGNTECIRNQSLHIVVTPKTEEKRSAKRRRSDMMRKARRNTNTVSFESADLPLNPSEERKWCVFYADDGGFRSSDDQDKPSDKLYYVGVIDILTPYNIVKKVEHVWKSITQDKEGISAVHPIVYDILSFEELVKLITSQAQIALDHPYVFKRPIKNVVVIGAGPHGLCSARHLKETGMNVKVFERNGYIGGLWKYSDTAPPKPKIPTSRVTLDESSLKEVPTDGSKYQRTFEITPELTFALLKKCPPSACYRDLITNIPSTVFAFPDFPMPKEMPVFPKHQDMLAYFESYAEAFGLLPLIELNTSVDRVMKIGDEWELVLSKYDIYPSGFVRETRWRERFDAVVAASGLHQDPYVPDIKDLAVYNKMWPTKVAHSKQFRRPEDFKDKNVLIVGVGISGVDIARSLDGFAKSIVMAYKDSFTSPFMVINIIRSKIPKDTVIKPEVVSFSNANGQVDGTITFQDGTFIKDVDQIFFCTGYKNSLGHHLLMYQRVRLFWAENMP